MKKSVLLIKSENFCRKLKNALNKLKKATFMCLSVFFLVLLGDILFECYLMPTLALLTVATASNTCVSCFGIDTPVLMPLSESTVNDLALKQSSLQFQVILNLINGFVLKRFKMLCLLLRFICM